MRRASSSFRYLPAKSLSCIILHSLKPHVANLRRRTEVPADLPQVVPFGRRLQRAWWLRVSGLQLQGNFNRRAIDSGS